MTSLAELKSAVKTILLEEGLGAALKRLRESLPENSKAYDEAVLLEAALKEANLKMARGSIGQTELDVRYNGLRERLMTLLDSLDERDLQAAQSGKKSKQGSLLYQIPGLMEVAKETRCRVRIAYDEAALLENIELTRDTRIKEVRVAEVMEVELIDRAETPAFSIRTFNRQDQFVEKDEYTEWIFFVKPLREGQFPLMLRVSVIEKVGDKERVRDIVLEESVVIVAEPVEEGAGAGFKASGLKVGEGAAPKKAPSRKLLRTNTLALIGLIAFSTLTPAIQINVDWTIASMRDDRETYAKFAERHKGRPKAQKALEKIEEIDWQALRQEPPPVTLEDYLALFPEALNTDEAAEKLKDSNVLEKLAGGVGIIGVNPFPASHMFGTNLSSPSEGERPLYGSWERLNLGSSIVIKTPSPSAYFSALFAPDNMVAVKGGIFTMGCQDALRDGDCFSFEKPPRQVTVKDFKIGKYEVTQAQWRAVMGEDPPELYNKGCDECPVERVSWNDIQDFLKKLNEQTGQRYRLPTEAEWEFAARGGNKSQGYMYSGSKTIGEVAWYDDNYKSGNTYGSQKTTRPVGQKKPNELGLYDMSGNVWERCEDDWHGSYSGAPTDGRAWIDSPRGSYRVYRGGSWGIDPRYCRAAYRYAGEPAIRANDVGFRLAL